MNQIINQMMNQTMKKMTLIAYNGNLANNGK